MESCRQHTPTLIELYSAQSKVLKHAGDPQGAATTADEARRLDLADRCTCLVASTQQHSHHTGLGAEAVPDVPWVLSWAPEYTARLSPALKCRQL